MNTFMKSTLLLCCLTAIYSVESPAIKCVIVKVENNSSSITTTVSISSDSDIYVRCPDFGSWVLYSDGANKEISRDIYPIIDPGLSDIKSYRLVSKDRPIKVQISHVIANGIINDGYRKHTIPKDNTLIISYRFMSNWIGGNFPKVKIWEGDVTTANVQYVIK
jgi:hypothetical protein